MSRKNTISTKHSRPRGRRRKGIRSVVREVDVRKITGTGTPSKQWRPPDGIFLLENSEVVKNMRLNRGEWLGIWIASKTGQESFYASRSPQALYHTLKGNDIRWPVSARLGKSRNELSSLTARRDHLRNGRVQAHNSLARARNIANNQHGIYTSMEVKKAIDYLRDLSNEARNKGKRRGDTATASEHQQMLGVFWDLSQGKTLKQIVIDGGGSENYENRIRSFSVRMSRFSKRVTEVVSAEYGNGDQIPDALYQHERVWLRLSSLFGIKERWAGVSSNSRRHGYALCEALNRCKLGRPET